jgi:hypothetical protein
MRWFCLVCLGVLALAGCRGSGAHNGTPPLIVTPALGLKGKITLVNVRSQFVVVSYPLGGVPAAERRLNVYRNGLKVAEIKINEFRRDINIVADIVTGECQVGDEVRED